jgi:thioredoxin 1
MFKEVLLAVLNHIDSDTFHDRVLESAMPVLVEFGAPWCGPCKMLEPVLAELAEEYAGRVAFFSVNVDQAPDLAADYGVMGVPTVLLFRQGEVKERITGYRPKKILVRTFFNDL